MLIKTIIKFCIMNSRPGLVIVIIIIKFIIMIIIFSFISINFDYPQVDAI